MESNETRARVSPVLSTDGLERKSRYFGIWFGWRPPLKARTKEAMTRTELMGMMDPRVVREREAWDGPMTVEPITKHRFYAL